MNNIEKITELIRKAQGCENQNCFDCEGIIKCVCDENGEECSEFIKAKNIATALDKQGYRKQSETVKEFAEKVKFGMAQFGYYFCGINGVEYFGDIQVNDFTKMINNLAEQYGKEEKV